jgi:GGDEF domain-containing protein
LKNHQRPLGSRPLQWRIQRLAYFDTLTDLPNRSLLLDRLEMALRQHDRLGEFELGQPHPRGFLCRIIFKRVGCHGFRFLCSSP